ncbi:histidine phosphatase family protein [Pandoraea fibrosis]|uniref:Histidine phosphatase family protein n=1 Tax=Pandoraea fibrosis TaxID=1891094 RepID=A0ABX6HXV5_9BURK|nr:histidine phosphatase family protein [Pandoraea fibrosis]QHE94995.1 histidine phosphatase family protein [Pandoraea fibrosis]QHF15732.1 histidine phosphatase family protein [Pandoraea fibrosis]
MNLILWRHADAENLPAPLALNTQADLARELTDRGRKQADKAAQWLRPRLPDDTLILSSPAVRAVQTAQALTPTPRIVRDLAPGANAMTLLGAIGWPNTNQSVVIVGHQPALGQLAALLLSGQEAYWTIKKGGIWWLSSRRREDESQVVVRAVVNPDLM